MAAITDAHYITVFSITLNVTDTPTFLEFRAPIAVSTINNRIFSYSRILSGSFNATDEFRLNLYLLAHDRTSPNVTMLGRHSIYNNSIIFTSFTNSKADGIKNDHNITYIITRK